LDRLGKAMIIVAESETSRSSGGVSSSGADCQTTRRRLRGGTSDWVQAHRPRSQLVPRRPREGHFRRHLSVSPVPAVRIRAEVAGAARFHRLAAFCACSRSGWRMPIRRDSRALTRIRSSHGTTTRRSTVPIGNLRAARWRKARGAPSRRTFAARRTHMPLRLDKRRWRRYAMARLHQKVATTIFFESNGGQAKAERHSRRFVRGRRPDLDNRQR